MKVLLARISALLPMRVGIFLLLFVGMLGAAGITRALINDDRHRDFLAFHRERLLDRFTQELQRFAESDGAELTTRDGERTGRRHRRGGPVGLEARWREPVVPDTDLAASLAQALGAQVQAVAVASGGFPPCPEGHQRPRTAEFPLHPPPRCDGVSARFSDGRAVSFNLLGPPLPPDQGWLPQLTGRPALYLAGFVASLALLAWLAARLSTAALQRLSAAADRLDLDGLEAPALAVTGPPEVHRTAAAFLRMQSRIAAQVRERTTLLAHISHDLRTPLTRLRLRLEQVADDGLRERLLDDLRAATEVVDEGLELARSLDGPRELKPVDLPSLMHSLVEDYRDAGSRVEAGRVDAGTVASDVVALRRILVNLLDNAVKYAGAAALSCQREGQSWVVRVTDRGPGIPEGEFERMLRPFERLEASRHRDTGGTGLGLAIAHNLARRLGGQLELANRSEGGLEARLRL